MTPTRTPGLSGNDAALIRSLYPTLHRFGAGKLRDPVMIKVTLP